MSDPNNQNPYGQQNPYDGQNGYYQQPQYQYGQQYGQPTYPQGQYGQQPYIYPQQPQQRWNGMAIAGFVCSFFVSIVGLVLSIIGLTQVNKSHERGRGLAIAGIVISAISIVGEILLAIGLVSLIGSAADYGYDYSDYGDYGSATSSIQSGVDVPADPLAGLPVRVA